MEACSLSRSISHSTGKSFLWRVAVSSRVTHSHSSPSLPLPLSYSIPQVFTCGKVHSSFLQLPVLQIQLYLCKLYRTLTSTGCVFPPQADSRQGRGKEEGTGFPFYDILMDAVHLFISTAQHSKQVQLGPYLVRFCPCPPQSRPRE